MSGKREPNKGAPPGTQDRPARHGRSDQEAFGGAETDDTTRASAGPDIRLEFLIDMGSCTEVEAIRKLRQLSYLPPGTPLRIVQPAGTRSTAFAAAALDWLATTGSDLGPVTIACANSWQWDAFGGDYR